MRNKVMVGSRELESPTSSVSRKRSNQLSYEPIYKNLFDLIWAVTAPKSSQPTDSFANGLPCQDSALTNGAKGPFGGNS
jgi:hypothetical protein